MNTFLRPVKQIPLLLMLVIGSLFLVSMLPVSAIAATTPPCAPTEQEVTTPPDPNTKKSANGKTYCIARNNGASDIKNNPIYVWLKGILRFLAVGVGLAVTGGIIWGGLKYMTARGNASQTQEGIYVITNAVVGLLLFIFMMAIVNTT